MNHWLLLIIAVFSCHNSLSDALQKKQAAIHYHDICCYQKDVDTVITEARNYLLSEVAKNSKKSNPDKLALVFDIDDTTLSNFQNMLDLNFEAGKQGRKLRLYHIKARDPVISQSLKLFQLAKRHNVAVFFISGRDELLHYATVHNLLEAGYRNWDGLYLRPYNYHKPSVVPFKAGMRRRIEQMGFRIIASIGDQESDYTGGHTARGFKLPNPYYRIQ